MSGVEVEEVEKGKFAAWTHSKFSGAVYRNMQTMTDDNPARFETSKLLLRDYTIRIRTNNALLGDASTQDFPLDANEDLHGREIDLSTLYFRNASAGLNMTIYIFGTRE